MNTTAGLEPQYVERFRRQFALEGGRLERHVYSRPVAHGDVRAYLALPPKPRRVVVIAHATGNDCLYPQISLIRALTRAGTAVFTFDVDGHGHGSTTLLSPQSLPDAAIAGLAVARSQVPGVPAYLLGISLGGLLALRAAASQRVDGLVIIVSPTHTTRSLAALAIEAAGLVRPSVLRQMQTYGALGFLPAIGPFRREAFPVRLGAGLGNGALTYLNVVKDVINNLHAIATAATVTCKALLIYGGHDLIAPAQQGRAMAGALQNARFVEVPGGTHFSTPLLPVSERLITDFIL